MKVRTHRSLLAVCILGSMLAAPQVMAKGRLVVYCSATNAMCEAETKAFSEKFDVKTSFVRNGSGSTLAKIEAEKKNPRADVWYGGTLDPQSQAGEMDLLHAYQSPQLENIMEDFKDPAKRKGNYSSAVYMGILGFGVNTKRLEEKGLPIPRCWSDLTKPEYKDEIQIADPQSSGTAYTALATFIQLWDEDKAFDYFQSLDKNISQYTKSGVTPSRNSARGEIAIGIGFLHDYSLEQSKGAPLELISPCEGTGYEIGGVSIIKGARNLDNAKKFVDFVMSKEGQELAWKKGKSFQILTNTKAEQSPNALDPKQLKLISYDMDKYGSSAERKRLINKWVNQVKMGG
ncbi:ABC transporter substrate-binding protein [Vibrio mediterranei]|jgi:iron(III) transport system substrate-binding protein|uniref:ABC transporter substrate-binding protein n=1 Tax=Vibrio mediterranei TaxID=689 RepID=UPI001EFDDE00|nr:ABC transporter substrate-binding protein [Vibrio mediterranei]MCG9625476.1 ABC transporter substrate-binding protein [Vibrio mediterranei]MCY9856055.1 ABC transporter substrate-binding protein [Vibrio mediterranei]